MWGCDTSYSISKLTAGLLFGHSIPALEPSQQIFLAFMEGVGGDGMSKNPKGLGPSGDYSPQQVNIIDSTSL